MEGQRGGQALGARCGTERTDTKGTELAPRGHWEPGVAVKGHDGQQK